MKPAGLQAFENEEDRSRRYSYERRAQLDATMRRDFGPIPRPGRFYAQCRANLPGG